MAATRSPRGYPLMYEAIAMPQLYRHLLHTQQACSLVTTASFHSLLPYMGGVIRRLLAAGPCPNSSSNVPCLAAV